MISSGPFDNVTSLRRLATLTAVIALLFAACGDSPPGEGGGDAGAADGSGFECQVRVDGGCRCQYEGKTEGVCSSALIDPETGQCAAPDSYESAESSCADGRDNDCDAKVDCEDPDCTGNGCGLGEGSARCVAGECQELVCHDDVDNDEDGDTDCSDVDCTGSTCEQGTRRTCPPPETYEPDDEMLCEDGVDNDCDGATDETCGCTYDPTERDGVDTDGSRNSGVCTGQTQDENGECPKPSGFEVRESKCADGKDNDCDGDVDCADSSCLGEVCGEGQGQATCRVGGCAERGCFDGTDNDGDGKTDCADSDCTGRTCNRSEGVSCPAPADWEPGGEQSCGDGIDNDCDGNVDKGCPCTYDPTENKNIDTNDDYKNGVCTGQMMNAVGVCQTPKHFETRTIRETRCQGSDNDCDGFVDEGCSCTYDPTETNKVDTDSSHDAGICTGRNRDKQGVCVEPSGFETNQSGSESASHCNDGTDQDCDGAADDGCPCDFNGTSVGVCSNGTRDSNDGSCTIQPPNYEGGNEASSSCDQLDNDCDGSTDDWGDVSCAWVELVGTSNRDDIVGVAADSSGAVYVVGETSGNLGGHSNSGPPDAFLAKYDASGNQKWVRLLGSSNSEFANGVAVGASGGVYVSGSTRGDLFGQTNNGSTDYFVARFDPSGNRSWGTLVGGPNKESEEGRGGISVYSTSSDVYLAGVTDGGLGGHTNQGRTDVILANLDAATGATDWIEQIGTSDFDTAAGVATDGAGNAYAVGTTPGDLAGNSNSGKDDVFLAKFGPSGSQSWVELLGTAGDEVGQGVAASGTGAVYVSGIARSDIGGQTNSGATDALLSKFDTSGARKWVRLLGSANRERGYGVSVDGAGDPYLAGVSNGDLAGKSNSGFDDAFTAQYDSSGNRNWVRLFGSVDTDSGRGIATPGSGEVYVGGRADSGFGGASYNGGSGDGFLVRLQ